MVLSSLQGVGPKILFFTLHLYTHFLGLRRTRLNGIITSPYPEVTGYLRFSNRCLFGCSVLLFISKHDVGWVPSATEQKRSTCYVTSVFVNFNVDSVLGRVSARQTLGVKTEPNKINNGVEDPPWDGIGHRTSAMMSTALRC